MYCLSMVLTKIRPDETKKFQQEIQIGFIADTVASRDGSVTVRSFIGKIWPRVAASECDIYFDGILRPIGCVCWITRTERMLGRAVPSSKARHKNQQVRRGTSLLIVDFLFQQGDIRSMLRGVRENLLSKETAVCYVRQNAGRRWEARVRSAPGIRSALKHIDAGAASNSWQVGNDSLEKCEDQLAKLAVIGHPGSTVKCV